MTMDEKVTGTDQKARAQLSQVLSGNGQDFINPLKDEVEQGAELAGFVLVGFGGGAETQALLFAVFLALYVVTVLGNLTMILVITLDARLHSPMYFFLKNLSFVDLCYSSVIAPKAMTIFLSSSKVISFEG
ncbi:Olfactory receptor 12 [Microtus ochrogaster]|uniref:Olfactory receptor 12 n=1 Tax=Microtus ochrogaster TaxID=79684 RepID=A0A8J6KZL1_MICOH|nr:Olfactory receptor 12 [Microtus ochrogaster]